MLTKEQIIETALPVLLRHGVIRAGLFGSFATGEANERSDIDLLVQPREDGSLFTFIALKHALEDALHAPVDLVDYQAIKPGLERRILDEEVRFHG
ncbi:MAG: nucleotidyltransferase domain-containing protein [Flavobacteriales bacterium]